MGSPREGSKDDVDLDEYMSKHTASTEPSSLSSSLSSSGLSAGATQLENGAGSISQTIANHRPRRRTSTNDGSDDSNAKHAIISGDGTKDILVAKEDEASRLSLDVCAEVRVIVQQSKILNNEKQLQYWSQLPRFLLDELMVGETLGSGQYGIVKEIAEVRLQKRAYDYCTDEHGVGKTGQDEGAIYPVCNDVALEGREFISTHCNRRFTGNSIGNKSTSRTIQKKEKRYALKRIKSSCLTNSETCFCASLDLAIEAYYLSSMEHPNIVKLRGLAMEEPGYSSNFFIVMDRLYDNLTQRIKRWKKRDKKTKKIVRIFFRGDCKTKKERLLDERLTTAADLADALRYMHEKNILHRDLKPDNIGFDVRDDVKIFDFGLAKEVYPSPKSGVCELNEEETYELSGETGSLRYMAPEVYRNESYNSTVDVYSFGVILWEMLALEQPFRGFDRSMMKQLTFELEWRPKIDRDWPSNVRKILSDCWSANYIDRPASSTLALVLKEELIRMRGDCKDEKGIDHRKRRSTYLSSLRRSSITASLINQVRRSSVGSLG